MTQTTIYIFVFLYSTFYNFFQVTLVPLESSNFFYVVYWLATSSNHFSFLVRRGVTYLPWDLPHISRLVSMVKWEQENIPQLSSKRFAFLLCIIRKINVLLLSSKFLYFRLHKTLIWFSFLATRLLKKCNQWTYSHHTIWNHVRL